MKRRGGDLSRWDGSNPRGVDGQTGPSHNTRKAARMRLMEEQVYKEPADCTTGIETYEEEEGLETAKEDLLTARENDEDEVEDVRDIDEDGDVFGNLFQNNGDDGAHLREENDRRERRERRRAHHRQLREEMEQLEREEEDEEMDEMNESMGVL
ncbi:hypothetical protein PMAYCL1PPCAC_23493, partial [Pristionchus mayeri]